MKIDDFKCFFIPKNLNPFDEKFLKGNLKKGFFPLRGIIGHIFKGVKLQFHPQRKNFKFLFIKKFFFKQILSIKISQQI